MSLSIDISLEEINSAQLFEQMQQDNDLYLLDVRSDEEFNNWKVEGLHTPETGHLFYGEFIEDEANSVARVPTRRNVVVVCAKGGASKYVADILRQNYAIPAVNLAGGMIAWGNYYHRRQIAATSKYQIYQFDRVARGCLSYVLISQGQAAMIDPGRHWQQYLDFIQAHSARLALVLDTHAHADHISGGPALAAETGSTYYLHPYDGIHPFDMLPAKMDYEMLKDDLAFNLGELTLRCLHTPGHTLGLVNILANAPGGEAFLFTGDSLFIKSFGRPDLGGQGQAWVPLVYTSIFETIRGTIPGTAWVLPGHYAQASEADQDGLYARRLEQLWEENDDLRIPKEQFVQYVLAHLPALPPQYIEIKRVNIGLVNPDELEASELELGKNFCALSTAY
jgi:glyoxylase-like metal-dependent hydrolase (beta-lactamase superfamily II)